MTDAPDSKRRFSDRVDDYVRYRPSYPVQVVELLRDECALRPGRSVADVGAGTGIFTRQLLEYGARVVAVEPNAEMRAAADRLLAKYPEYRSVDGSAEATGLPDGSVDGVTAAQAFHWFDPDAARVEFRRIVRPRGWIALVWNERLTDTTRFLREYEGLLRTFATDYEKVNHVAASRDGRIERFFGTAGHRVASFPNRQRFDFDGLRGRLLSSSYAPKQGDPRHAPLMAALRELYERESRDGAVVFEYETKVFFGALE